LSGYGISDTKTNFNTALSDGDFLFVGDAPTSHTHPASEITAGTFDSGTYNLTGQLNVDNIRIDGNTISETAVNGGNSYLRLQTDSTTTDTYIQLNGQTLGSPDPFQINFSAANGFEFFGGGIELITDNTSGSGASLWLFAGTSDSSLEFSTIRNIHDSGFNTLDYVLFETRTASATANKGKYVFSVDEVSIFEINDSGLSIIGDITLTKSLYTTEDDDGNSGTSLTVNWTERNFKKVTLTGNCTFTFTAPTGATTLILKLLQDGTGSRTVTWPSSVKWSGGTAPTLTTTVGRSDIISFYFDGTYYIGTSVLNFNLS
jgi:hypothetical protein